MTIKYPYLKLFSAILVLLGHTLFGQLYSGKNLDRSGKPGEYNYLLRINNDNTVNFVYNDDNDNTVYGDHYGKIKKLNDTLFHISLMMTIGQYLEMAPYTDSIFVGVDHKITNELGKIRIIYSNGSFQEYTNYNTNGIDKRYFSIKANKALFNRTKGKNYFTISIKRKNSITQKPLVFKIPFGSAAYFTGNEKLEFDVVIKNGYLWTVGTRPIQTGHFRLKRESK